MTKRNLVRHEQRGYALLELTIAFVGIFGIAATAFTYSRSAISMSSGATAKRLIAEYSAMDLLEFFRSVNEAELNAYMSLHQYEVCQKVVGTTGTKDTNKQQKTNSVNNDSLASFFVTPGGAPIPESTPSRYYEITVFDLAAQVVKNGYCGKKAPYILKANEAFLVTAGATWTYQHAKNEVVFSTLLQKN